MIREFIEKWKNDSKYKAKIQLTFYGVFMLFAIVIAAAGNRYQQSSQILENKTTQQETVLDNEKIKTPEEYKYTIRINIDNTEYKFEGTKQQEQEIIKKISGDVTVNYVYENNEYYKENNKIYILTEQEEVYGPVDPNYVSLDTINKYLSKSTKENNIYKVYLKDIILETDSEDYISITLEEKDNKQTIINVDYTQLLKKINKDIEKYIVNIEIEKLEEKE